ncbi:MULTISPECIES: phage portal protein [Rhizobium/Agrobacterium group]|uniref:Phage-related protein n=2 Tax=Rhizobium/Agrobacterium group TaxID=227290 RepID=B9JVX7_ALLAM|nr:MULTISPECIES: phage portal protein [Rhizobium/Agrobacterium group]ACM36407.1 Phage-related protein [Allorhizobium ampelinum S4]MUO27705.1 phage portal protein [Agrobacterium vitis]MUO44236.1 phage portal protein [Agrobacterium vitis]MUP12316.1 phage portal protein [Agrobacterium vitis]
MASKKGKAERRSTSLESETVPVSATNFMEFFGLGGGALPTVNIETALKVPAVQAAVSFLSRTLATLPLHVYRTGERGPVRLGGKLAVVLEENPNDEMDTSKFRRFFWEQVFTGGRGLAWIERKGAGIEALWPIDPGSCSIRRRGGRLFYSFEGREYPATDVIDIPYMLKRNLVQHRGPIAMAEKAIQLALAMNDYASNFFAGGGVPPLALEGPMPANDKAMQRAREDIKRAVKAARDDQLPLIQLPVGYKLTQVGYDPAKGQMTEARLYQVQEIARAYQIPPNFLQDLSRATFSNVEQNDLYLVKHLVSQWATAMEGEMNLKIFGRMNTRRYVRHNLDGLMRGDFKSRLEALATGVNSALLTPNEGREIEGRPRDPNPAADQLYIQGATVAIGTSVIDTSAPGTNAMGENSDPPLNDPAADTERQVTDDTETETG